MDLLLAAGYARPMESGNQDPTFAPPRDDLPGWGESPSAPPPPPFPSGVLYRALALALLGAAALLLGQAETAFLVAFAALFFVAQAADTHRGFVPVHLLLAWILPALGVAALLGLAGMLAQAPHTPLRLGFAVFAGLGAFVAAATLFRPVADALARALLRDAAPGRVSRLAARAVVITLWCGPVAWAALRDVIGEMMKDPRVFVSASRLGGSLLGYVVLAFAAVGWGVRRDLRAALERLGLRAPRREDLGWIGLGIAALWLFNGGSEAIERRWLPELWRTDQSFSELLGGVMNPAQMVLLGLSAGIGEEITLRGALQPRLGLWLTALLFAVLHVQYSWYGMASIFFFGVILGAIRLRSGTTSAILVHAVYDLLAVAGAAATRT
jgi:membrane protease YdiL (CAAX protease family)